jgi:hypothetical protein
MDSCLLKVSFNMPGLLKKFLSNNKFVVDVNAQPLETIMRHRSFRLVAIILLTVCVVPSSATAQKGRSQQASPGTKAPPPLDFQSASAKRMFILVSDGSAISAISVDTTHIEDLRAALKLQELVFRISGARMPIVDKQFVREPGSGCVPGWGMIHIRWDHNPMSPRQHAFEISMKEMDPTASNPPKQVIIAGSPPGNIDSAVSAFTEATLGIPLDALNDNKYIWRQTKTVAIPEKMKTIHGRLGDK